MKKIVCIAISIMFFLTQFQTGKVFAQETHRKPSITLTAEQISQAKRELIENTKTKEATQALDKQVNTSNTRNSQELFIKSELTPFSFATPTLLNMDYFYPYVIAAAVAKNHRNIQSVRSGYNPLYYYYDNLGDLDYVNDSTGTKIADVSYCDGSEAYNCPIGWVDWIDFAPLSSHRYLEFFYSQDTPTVNYYASISSSDEPDLYFFNINMATGAPVTNPLDSLYDDQYGTRAIYRFDQIEGYPETTPISVDWYLWFNGFSNQRYTYISNGNDSKTATLAYSPSNSIYRFWSDKKQGHFFTASESEKNGIIANDPSWKYESVAYAAVTSQASQATPVYRFWSNSKQHHFYTTSAAEKNNIIANDHSWSYESVAYYAYASQLPNTTAVYRFWSDKKQGHFYTTSVTEKDNIIASDPSWTYESVAWYVPTN